MYKFTRAGYKCNETACVAPSVQCIKDGGKDPVEQAKAYLRATGACQDLDRARFDTVKKNLDQEEETNVVRELCEEEQEEMVEYVVFHRERDGHQRFLFAVQEQFR